MQYDELYYGSKIVDTLGVGYTPFTDAFKETFDPADDMNTWFGKIQQIGENLGYTADMKAYKADPSAFKGNVGDISMFLRVAVTGKLNSPDMYAVMQILGKDKMFARIDAMLAAL